MNTILLATLLSGAAVANPTPDSTALQRPPIAIDEVVVTGSNEAVGRNLLPYTVSVVDHQQLEALGTTRVLTAISGEVPSLFVSQRSILGFGVSNGGSGHINLRGIGGDRSSGVLMMVDGQPQFAGIYSHHIADFYSKENVERVEVLRGPGSVLYGSNAMGGAINIITRRPAKDGVHTQISSQYGSYNTWLSTVSNTVSIGRFSSLASVSYDRTDGNIRGLKFRQWSGYAKAEYRFSSHWRGAVDYSLTNFKDSDPVYPTLSNPESTDIYRQNIVRGEASATITNNYAGSLNGSSRIYYSYGNHFIDDPRHFHSTDDRLGIMIFQNFQGWTGSNITAGFDFDTYSGRIPVSGGTTHKPGSLTTMDRKRIIEYSPYVTLSQHLASDLLTLNGGLRLAASDMFHNRWIPQAGFALSPSAGLSLKGSVAVGYRNPSFRELYLYRMANPDLQPERLINYELSAAYAVSHYLYFDLTAYLSRGSNIIQVLDNRNVNTGRFINKGFEITARCYPIASLRLSATYSYLHSSLCNLTGAPRNQYFLGADWQALKQLRVSLDLKGCGGLFVSEGIKHQNYALLNTKISYSPISMLTLSLRLENITNAHYIINRGYDMPGFTAMGGFTLNI